MLGAIILLTGPIDDRPLSALLRQHNPRLEVRPVKTLADLDAVPANVLACGRLISFVAPVVVPARILDRLGYGGYNFHPGPPQYPGWMPSHFAIYHGATYFGATAHFMVEQVDAGPIVGVELFGIPAGADALRLEQLAFTEAVRLFWRLSPALARQEEPLAALPISWSGRKSTRRQFAAMCDIPLDITREELARRLAVFGANNFDLCSTATLHGFEFRFVRSGSAVNSAATDINTV